MLMQFRFLLSLQHLIANVALLQFQVVIEGFKSFKEQTTFEFQPGLNVVGEDT